MKDGIGIPTFFWVSETGAEPVRDWLKGLDKEDRRQIGEDIRTVQFGWPVGMPVCRPMGKGLFEVRSRISDGRIARVLFCFQDNRIVLLHGFIKKTQKTPRAIALKNLSEQYLSKVVRAPASCQAFIFNPHLFCFFSSEKIESDMPQDG